MQVIILPLENLQYKRAQISSAGGGCNIGISSTDEPAAPGQKGADSKQ